MGAVGDAGMWTSCENEQLCRCSAKYVNTEIKSNEPTFIVIILEICFMAFLWWCVTSTKLLWWVVIKLKVIHYFNAGTEWQNTMDFYWKRRQRFANAVIFFVMHLGIKISMFTFFFCSSFGRQGGYFRPYVRIQNAASLHLSFLPFI